MKKLLLLLPLLFFFMIAEAQPDYKPGYIITSQNDSLQGYIKYNPKDIQSQTILFKKKYNDFNTYFSYSIDSVKRFYIYNLGHFESMNLKTNFMDYGKVYVQLIYEGNLDMLFFNKKYIIRADNGTCMELRKINYVEKETDINVIRVSTPYITFLKEYMKDCQEINKDIDSLVLYNRTLRRFYRNYHTCINAPYKSYLRNSIWNTIDLGIVAGINAPVFKSNSQESGFSHMNEDLWDYKSGLVAGFYTNIRIPGLYHKLMLHTGAMYSSTSISTVTVDESPVYTVNYLNIDFSTLKIPFGLVHRFTDRRISPFIDFGICGNFVFNDKTEWSVKQANRDMVATELIPLRHYQTGMFSGAGLMVKFASNLRIVLEGRYEKYGEIDEATPQYNSLYTTLNNFSFMMGINIDE